MSRNPLYLKCKKCGDFQHHWIMFLETIGKKAKVCYECDTVRDIENSKDIVFQGHHLEVLPLEASLDKTVHIIEDRE